MRRKRIGIFGHSIREVQNDVSDGLHLNSNGYEGEIIDIAISPERRKHKDDLLVAKTVRVPCDNFARGEVSDAGPRAT